MDRTTGEVIAAAARQTSAVSSAAQNVQMKIRLVVEDRAGSNERSERAELRRRKEAEEEWRRLHLPCQVHITAGCCKKVFQPEEDVISGQINLTLAVNFGTGLHDWRLELASIITERWVIRVSRPSVGSQSTASLAEVPSDARAARWRLSQ